MRILDEEKYDVAKNAKIFEDNYPDYFIKG